PLLRAFGTPEAIFEASEEKLRELLPDMGAGTRKAILGKRTAESARAIALWCHQNGVRILPLDHAEYPAVLRELDEPPALLYCRGRLPDLYARASVGVVGPRRTDAYGESVTYKISFELAAAGAVIVSGLAEGVDGVATAAALLAGGTPIAVLGCGIDVTYPRHHTRLSRECVEHGAVITEYAPGTPPNGHHFPVRNRLISALSDAVLVTQAGEHSGALITARYAVVQGRPLYAVPGNVTSPLCKGSNRLLQSGAYPVLESRDLLAPLMPRYHSSLCEKQFAEAAQYSELDTKRLSALGLHLCTKEENEMNEGAPKRKKEKKQRKNKKRQVPLPEESEEVSRETAPDLSLLTPRQRELYTMLPKGPFTADVLTAKGVAISEAASTLTLMEIYGLLTARPGGTFELK
ncbi:MAG: DNA-processing protein DprA, partial [Clostridia bacterium]|nr:DNA-processing protein DprA [Clostridia bacterium]